MAMERLLKHAPVHFGELRQTEAAGGFSLALLLRFVRELRQMRPSLVHVRGLGNEGFHAALAARLAGVPNILVSVHGTHRDLQYVPSSLRHWIVVKVLEPLTLMMATHIATVCEYAAARPFLQTFKNKLVAVVPNGVDLPCVVDSQALIRSEFGIPKDLPLAVAVSRITEEKGYLVLADALRLLDSLGLSFAVVVVGGGDESGEIRSRFGGLHNVVVRFVGHRTDVSNFLVEADFFVFPSLHENLSNALLEAMSHSLPVVASDTGGNTEVLLRGGGVLVPPGQAEPLALGIRKMLESADVRKHLGIEARRVVCDFYTVQHMVKNWLSVYEQILGGPLSED